MTTLLKCCPNYVTSIPYSTAAGDTPPNTLLHELSQMQDNIKIL